MLPISDENPTRRFPLVTVLLIAANIAVFAAWQMRLGLAQSVAWGGLVPHELHPVSAAGIRHLFTSMFMHAGILHLLGNLWFLWIFGDNVEDDIGRIRFLLLYLASGVAAAATHVALNVQSALPLVGASGAISGVLGAYLVLHPVARVKTLVFIRFIRIPAWIFLILWIGLQVFALSQTLKGKNAGIAYAAHVGGFVAGMILAIAIRPRQNTRRG
jgi:membrane associated rhomboid family serine protease